MHEKHDEHDSPLVITEGVLDSECKEPLAGNVEEPRDETGTQERCEMSKKNEGIVNELTSIGSQNIEHTRVEENITCPICFKPVKNFKFQKFHLSIEHFDLVSIAEVQENFQNGECAICQRRLRDVNRQKRHLVSIHGILDHVTRNGTLNHQVTSSQHSDVFLSKSRQEDIAESSETPITPDLAKEVRSEIREFLEEDQLEVHDPESDDQGTSDKVDVNENNAQVISTGNESAVNTLLDEGGFQNKVVMTRKRGRPKKQVKETLQKSHTITSDPGTPTDRALKKKLKTQKYNGNAMLAIGKKRSWEGPDGANNVKTAKINGENTGINHSQSDNVGRESDLSQQNIEENIRKIKDLLDD